MHHMSFILSFLFPECLHCCYIYFHCGQGEPAPTLVLREGDFADNSLVHERPLTTCSPDTLEKFCWCIPCPFPELKDSRYVGTRLQSDMSMKEVTELAQEMTKSATTTHSPIQDNHKICKIKLIMSSRRGRKLGWTGSELVLSFLSPFRMVSVCNPSFEFFFTSIEQERSFSTSFYILPNENFQGCVFSYPIVPYLLCIALIRCCASQVQCFFFVAMSQFDWPITPKKK